MDAKASVYPSTLETEEHREAVSAAQSHQCYAGWSEGADLREAHCGLGLLQSMQRLFPRGSFLMSS